MLVIMRRGDVLLWWIPSTTKMLDGGAPSQLLRAYITGDNVLAAAAAALLYHSMV